MRNIWSGLTILLIASMNLFAGDSYQASLEAGDSLRAAGNANGALAEYKTALEQAANDTEKSLALGKQGVVYVYDIKDYGAAKAAARQALDFDVTKPVARVTALQVLADALMKADSDYAAAAAALEKAKALEGVEWAMPSIALSLGDCYRFSGKFEEAVQSFRSVLDMGNADNMVKAVASLNLGQTYQYSLRIPEKAKQAYYQAKELNPGLAAEIDDHLAKLP